MNMYMTNAIVSAGELRVWAEKGTADIRKVIIRKITVSHSLYLPQMCCKADSPAEKTQAWPAEGGRWRWGDCAQRNRTWSVEINSQISIVGWLANPKPDLRRVWMANCWFNFHHCIPCIPTTWIQFVWSWVSILIVFLSASSSFSGELRPQEKQ